jgi:hypothetical protein
MTLHQRVDLVLYLGYQLTEGQIRGAFVEMFAERPDRRELRKVLDQELSWRAEGLHYRTDEQQRGEWLAREMGLADA